MIPKIILPGSKIGILGNGQLGKMLALKAKQMGYQVITFAPKENSKIAKVADQEFVASYDDKEKLTEFAKSVDVITFEFENIPYNTLEYLNSLVIVRPSPNVLKIFQNRIAEKTFLKELDLPIVKFIPVNSKAELVAGIEELELPCILKTSILGYDGKGQWLIKDQIPDINFPGRYILEQFVNFGGEASMVAARGVDGSFTHYGLIENYHKDHILDISLAPAELSDELTNSAINITKKIFETLDVVGVMCIEFFYIGNKLIINEVAPRTHNSGHLTIEACNCSQFEQQLRAICGLPLIEVKYKSPAAMINLLGNLWKNGEPNFMEVLKNPNVNLHLYGKEIAKDGRKMGHITVLADNINNAKQLALGVRESL